MDKTICELIDGVGDLSSSFMGGDIIYWEFPKYFLENNQTLLAFLLANGNLIPKDFLIRDKEIIDDNYFNSKLFLESSENYLVHDATRHMLYFFCIYKLKGYITIFYNNIMNCASHHIRFNEDKTKFYYPFEKITEIEEELYSGISLKKSIRKIFALDFYLRRSYGNGYVLDLTNIKQLVDDMGSTYDFSNVKIE